VEERHLKDSQPQLSEEGVKDEVSVSLLTDLQEKQTVENKAIQELMQNQVSHRQPFVGTIFFETIYIYAFP